MRQQFVEGTRAQAEEQCPWAAEYVECEGGYWCFECADEAELWRSQK